MTVCAPQLQKMCARRHWPEVSCSRSGTLAECGSRRHGLDLRRVEVSVRRSSPVIELVADQVVRVGGPANAMQIREWDQLMQPEDYEDHHKSSPELWWIDEGVVLSTALSV